MPQADRITVAVKLKGLLPAPRADRIGTSTLDRNDDLSLFQFGLQNADFGKVQRKLDHWRHRSIPFKRKFGRLQPATTLTALQDHNILGPFRQFPESQKLRALEKLRGGHIPAIALTAYARQEDRLRALAAGYERHVPKPIEPDELLAAVASLA